MCTFSGEERCFAEKCMENWAEKGVQCESFIAINACVCTASTRD